MQVGQWDGEKSLMRYIALEDWELEYLDVHDGHQTSRLFVCGCSDPACPDDVCEMVFKE